MHVTFRYFNINNSWLSKKNDKYVKENNYFNTYSFYAFSPNMPLSSNFSFGLVKIIQIQSIL